MMNSGVQKQKRMRKGTKSCLPCRRRKIRCSGSFGEGRACNECAARGDTNTCRAQGVAATDDDDDSVTNSRLLQRIAELEARLSEASSPSGSANQTHGDHAHTSSLESMERLLSNVTRRAAPTQEAHSDEQQEDVVETTAAPLVLTHRLINTIADDANAQTDEPSVEHANQEKRRSSPFYAAAVRGLSPHLPSASELSDILDNHSSWWTLYQETHGLVWSKVQHTTLRAFATEVLTDGHPTLLGLLLVCLCISTGDVRRYLPPVEQFIINNDEFAGSEYGLGCLMAINLCYLTSMQPRKAWLACRRALSLLQLNGLHLRRKSEKHELLFWQLFHADRWVSLLIGLPYMMVEKVCDLTIPAMETTSPGYWFFQQLGIITGRVIDCLQSPNGPTMSATMEVEEQLDRVRIQLPSGYLDMAQIRACIEPMEKYTRLFRVINFHQLRAYVHLPFLLRSATQEDRYQYSRAGCIEDSRRQLEAYLELIDADVTVVAQGGVVNANAFTAATVVLLGLIGYGQSRETSQFWSQAQADQDWKMIYRTIEALKEVGKNKTVALLCATCYKALESLVSNAQAPHDQPAKRVVLPYFGTVSISHRGPPEPSSLPPSEQQSGSSPFRGLAQGSRATYDTSATQRHNNTISNTTIDSNLPFDMTFAYDGPFLPESDMMSWMPTAGFGPQSTMEAGYGWYDDLTDWNWLASSIPSNTGL